MVQLSYTYGPKEFACWIGIEMLNIVSQQKEYLRVIQMMTITNLIVEN